MPPKKKKASPIVVGTVSTRSTRRESIVNIEIIPRANKSSKTVGKRGQKKPPQEPLFSDEGTKEETTSNENKFEKTNLKELDDANPKILEILKDWSDEENSQQSATGVLPSTRKDSVFSDDQQSLLDILEDPLTEVSPAKPQVITSHCSNNQQGSASHVIPKTIFVKEDIGNNPIKVDSPQVEEPEIIEEFVVEDNSIIIEIPEKALNVVKENEETNEEDAMSTEDISIVDNKLGSPAVEPRTCNPNEEELKDGSSNSTDSCDREVTQIQEKAEKLGIIDDSSDLLLKNHYLTSEDNSRLSSITGLDEKQSVVSEDTTSQSMVTVQDENVENNVIRLSDNDNSLTNYEVIEEQVICDSSEPIIIENIDDHNEIVIRDNTPSSLTSFKNKVSYSEKSTTPANEHKKVWEGEPSHVAKILQDFLEEDSNSTDSVPDAQKSAQTFRINAEDTEKAVQKAEEIKGELLLKSISNKKSHLREVERGNELPKRNKNELPEEVSQRRKSLRSEKLTEDLKNVDMIDSLEGSLCKQISESMQIKETDSRAQFDPASEKLQEGLKNMHIQGEDNLAEKNLLSSSSNIDKVDTQKSPKLKAQTKKGRLESQGTRKSTRNKPSSSFENLDISVEGEIPKMQSTPVKLEQPANPEQAQITKLADSPKISPKKSVKKKETDTLKSQSFENILGQMDSMFSESQSQVKDNKQKYKKTKKQIAAEVSKMQTNLKIEEAQVLQPLATGDSSHNESVCETDSFSKPNKKSRAKSKTPKRQSLEVMDIDSDQSLQSQLDNTDTESKMDSSLDMTNRGAKKPPKKRTPKKQTEEQIKMEVDSESDVSKSMAELKMECENEVKSSTNIQEDKSEKVTKVKQKRTPKKNVTPKDQKGKLVKTPKESKKKKDTKLKKDDNSEEVRRSDRIKTIIPVKKKSHGLVRSKSEPTLSAEAETSDSNSLQSELEKPTLVSSPQLGKKDKIKTKAKSTESLVQQDLVQASHEDDSQLPKVEDIKADKSGQAEIEARLKSFIHLKENQYKTDRQVCKEARDMICDCYLAEEDIQNNEFGCGEDCLNRLLMIECGQLCQIGDRCTNKKFQKGQFAPVEVFKTEKKGLGLRAAANIAYGEFILEYVGEVLDADEFDARAEVYSKDKNIHFYFMSLRTDAIIDATMKGNISRFINHSCDPNAETQKWTVNGELRIGFFSTRTILAGEEITFDYRFQRYGKEAQKCYCGAEICRGWLGEQPDESEEEEEEEDEDEHVKEPTLDTSKSAAVQLPEEPLKLQSEVESVPDQSSEVKLDVETKIDVPEAAKTTEEVVVAPTVQESPKKVKKKPRKEILYEDFDQLNEDIDMLVTTGLKNQAHTLKLSRLMVRVKDLEQRKKILRVLRRGDMPCRRLFLDYHGLRLMHGYMVEAQQWVKGDKNLASAQLEFLQTKLELLQTLAVLPVQNKTMLIESKVLPAVEKWAKNEDLGEDNGDQKTPDEKPLGGDKVEPSVTEKVEEIKFLANKLLEEWANLKENFKIPKKQRIEQMKEHEKEANKKFLASNYAQEQEPTRKNDQRYRTWSRYKSERETNRKGSSKPEDKDKPSAAFLKISKHERRKLFALQMELKEEERRLKQREMWRQHEMNCMLIGADPRFTAPFDPNKGFQYIWNPSIGRWQALPVPQVQNQPVFSSPASSQGVTSFSNSNNHKTNLLGAYPPIINVPGIPGASQQYPGIQTNVPPPIVPGLPGSVPGITTQLPGISPSVPAIGNQVPGIPQIPGISQTQLSTIPTFQEVKLEVEDPSQVKFAGPIPPPVKLPPKWKMAKDKYGRPYYYHVKIRKSQWEPPPLPPPVPEEVEESSESTSSDSSSVSSSDSSSDSDTDDEMDDTKLLMEVRKQMECTSKMSLKSVIPGHVKKEEKDSGTPSPEVKMDSDNEEDSGGIKREKEEDNSEPLSSIDIRLKEQFNLDPPKKKKVRVGLCQEIIISPRTEEDRKQYKEDMKRYKATKEKLKRQKEQMLLQAKKKAKRGSTEDGASTSGSRSSSLKRSSKERRGKTSVKLRIKEIGDFNSESAKKIKETFRSSMASTVVGVLNAYRKPECKEARITNTEDFKHLARKLTHFVMLKEIKHLKKIEELECTESVKVKAREYIKKYMSKFGEVYQKRHDEPDFKD